jgi:hypothetical protein
MHSKTRSGELKLLAPPKLAEMRQRDFRKRQRKGNLGQSHFRTTAHLQSRQCRFRREVGHFKLTKPDKFAAMRQWVGGKNISIGTNQKYA